MESSAKARELLSELLGGGGANPTTSYKILLLGIRDAYEFHHDLLMERKPIDKAERLKSYYSEGLKYWNLHDRERAIYYLGGALYHLQDAWLSLAEDPSYESYLERALQWRQDLISPKLQVKQSGNLDDWVREAEKERKQMDFLVQQAVNLEDMVQGTPDIDQVTVHLARKAQMAGAALLLQFFLEATGSS